MPFRLGDIISVAQSNKKEVRPGMIGIVKKIKDEYNVGIQFSENVKGHNLEGGGIAGFCWFLPEGCLQKVTIDQARIGDRIVILSPNKEAYIGLAGFVRVYNKETLCYGVELDTINAVSGGTAATHTCDGLIPSKRGVWLASNEFVKEINPYCMIYPDMGDYITIVFE